MSPSSVRTIIGDLPKQQTFMISSIFDSGFAEFDQNVAFINLSTLENFDLSPEDEKLKFIQNPKIEQQKKIIQSIFKDDFVYSQT